MVSVFRNSIINSCLSCRYTCHLVSKFFYVKFIIIFISATLPVAKVIYPARPGLPSKGPWITIMIFFKLNILMYFKKLTSHSLWLKNTIQCNFVYFWHSVFQNRKVKFGINYCYSIFLSSHLLCLFCSYFLYTQG